MEYPTDKILETAQYYVYSLSADERGKVSIDTQTCWVGFADEDRRIEIREPVLVDPYKFATFWTDFQMPFQVVNSVDEYAKWYLFGGHSLIEQATAKEFLSNSSNERSTVRTGNAGFTSLKSLPKTLFRPAPTPKLRMAILKRDDYRCRVCGRRPERHVDIELHVHHIRPHGKRGPTHEDNLITLCNTCHHGLDPHQELSLYTLLEETGTDIRTKERRQYLKGVQMYRVSVQKLLAELEAADCL